MTPGTLASPTAIQSVLIFLRKIPEGASFASRQSVCRELFNNNSAFINRVQPIYLQITYTELLIMSVTFQLPDLSRVKKNTKKKNSCPASVQCAIVAF